MKFTDISKNNQTVTEMVGYTLGKPQTNNRKPVQKKTANPFDKSADDKKSQLQRIKDAGKKNWYAIEGQLDNPGAEDSPVAQAIIRRILLQRTDLLAKHGPERVVAAVDEVADFVGDVDEIGSSDVSGWIRHVEQMLGNMDQGVAEGVEQSLPPMKAELVEVMPPWDFEVAVYNPLTAQKEHYIIRPVDMWEMQMNRLQIMTADVRDLQNGNSFFAELESAPNKHYERVFDAISALFWNDRNLNKKLQEIIKHSRDKQTMHKPLPGVTRSQNVEIPADEYIKGAQAEKDLMARLQQGGKKGMAENYNNIPAPMNDDDLVNVIPKLYGIIYDQGDDALDYLDGNAPVFSKFWNKYKGDLDSIMDASDVGFPELRAMYKELVRAVNPAGVAENYPKQQDLSGISTEKLKAYLAKQGQQQSPGEGNQVKRVRAELRRRDQGVAEATGDKPFDSMMKTIKKGTAKQKTADRRAEKADSQQRARDAFGPNPAASLGIRKPSVAEGYAGVDDTDTVGFSVNTEAAYTAVMKRFGDVIDHDETTGIMYAPAGVWPRIEMVAFDADGEGAVKDDGVAEGSSTAMANTTKRLTDPKDGATAKLRAAGDQRREDQLKSRNIAKKNESATRSALGAAVKQINQSALTEACWKGYHKEGMKTMFGKQYPNCVKNKKKTTEDYTLEEIFGHTCPHCDGELVSEEFVSEKQDACYHKVKGRYKVWPSAYASGALVQCRKKGAANWGNKSESITQEEYDQLDENLKKWFSDKWVRFGPDGKIKGDCARGSGGEGKPKCLPQSKAQALGKKGRASAGARKRRQDPDADRSGKAINVNTRKKTESTKAQANKKY